MHPLRVWYKSLIICGIMALVYVHTLIPETCEYVTVHSKMDTFYIIHPQNCKRMHCIFLATKFMIIRCSSNRKLVHLFDHTVSLNSFTKFPWQVLSLLLYGIHASHLPLTLLLPSMLDLYE